MQHVEVNLSHTILPIGMGAGTATHKRGERHADIILELCSPPPDQRVRHQNGKVGINLRPRVDQDVHIA
jgi:hypothetical protein